MAFFVRRKQLRVKSDIILGKETNGVHGGEDADDAVRETMRGSSAPPSRSPSPSLPPLPTPTTNSTTNDDAADAPVVSDDDDDESDLL